MAEDSYNFSSNTNVYQLSGDLNNYKTSVDSASPPGQGSGQTNPAQPTAPLDPLHPVYQSDNIDEDKSRCFKVSKFVVKYLRFVLGIIFFLLIWRLMPINMFAARVSHLVGLHKKSEHNHNSMWPEHQPSHREAGQDWWCGKQWISHKRADNPNNMRFEFILVLSLSSCFSRP